MSPPAVITKKLTNRDGRNKKWVSCTSRSSVKHLISVVRNLSVCAICKMRCAIWLGLGLG